MLSKWEKNKAKFNIPLGEYLGNHTCKTSRPSTKKSKILSRIKLVIKDKKTAVNGCEG